MPASSGILFNNTCGRPLGALPAIEGRTSRAEQHLVLFGAGGNVWTPARRVCFAEQ